MDVDGTLIDADENLHPKDAALLENFPEHIQPIVTTGRSLYGARAVFRHNGIFRNQSLPLPGVFLNGGAAYLPQEVLCTKVFLSEQIHSDLLGLANQFSQAAFTFFTLKEVYLVNPNPFALHISRLHYLQAQEVAPQKVPSEVVKLMILDQNRQTLAEIKAITENWEVEGAYSLPYAFEINPPGITKAKTLDILLQMMKISDLPIFVVGDGENDLSLFKRADLSFAPSSAHPAIRCAADHIIPREKDGLLSPILKIIQ